MRLQLGDSSTEIPVWHYFALRNNGHAYEELLSWGLREDEANKANETPVNVKRMGSLSFADDTHVVRFTPGVY